MLLALRTLYIDVLCDSNPRGRTRVREVPIRLDCVCSAQTCPRVSPSIRVPDLRQGRRRPSYPRRACCASRLNLLTLSRVALVLPQACAVRSLARNWSELHLEHCVWLRHPKTCQQSSTRNGISTRGAAPPSPRSSAHFTLSHLPGRSWTRDLSPAFTQSSCRCRQCI